MTDAAVMVIFVLSLVALGNVGYLNSINGIYAFDPTSSQIVVILSILPAVIIAHRWSPGPVGVVVAGLSASLIINVALVEAKLTVILMSVPAFLVYYFAVQYSFRRREVQDAEKRRDALLAIAGMAGKSRSLKLVVGILEDQIVNVLGNVKVHVWTVDRARSELRVVASGDDASLERTNGLGLPIMLSQTGLVTVGDANVSDKNGGRLQMLAQPTSLPLTHRNVLSVAVLDRQSVQIPDISKVLAEAYPLQEEAIQNGGRGVLIQPIVVRSEAVALLVIECGFDRSRGLSVSERDFVNSAAECSGAAFDSLISAQYTC